MDARLWPDRLILERAGLYLALLGLDEQTLAHEPLCGVWTAQDVLAHIAGWEVRAARHLPDILADQGLHILGVEETPYNTEQVALRQAVPLAEQLDELVGALESIARTLDGVDTAALAQPRRVPWGEISVEGQIRMEAEHNAGHADEIRTWRKAAQAGYRPGPRCLLEAALQMSRWALERLAARMPTATRDQAPICGEWTLKDVIGHIADWEVAGTAAAEAMRAGALPSLPATPEQIDAWNAGHAARRRGEAWEATWAAYTAAMYKTDAILASLSDAELSHIYPSPGWFTSTYNCFAMLVDHNVEHSRQIAAWLEKG